ncbi:MAG: ATP-binding cassette domain-containing protein [Candidatus Eutrophobiaceae bacterium]
MSVPALEARRLCKVIGNRIILSDIEFSLVPGVCTGLLGRNGAGKSSLLRMLAGLIKPDLGEILVFGRSAMAEERWGDFAWLPENFTLPAFLSGEEFMRMQLRLRKREGWPWRDLLRCLDLPETCLRRSRQMFCGHAAKLACRTRQRCRDPAA